MAASSDENTDADVYYDLISDHKDVIIREIDINQTMKAFPHKDAISQSEFRKLYNEIDEVERSKRFINSLLKRRQQHELKAFFKIVTECDPHHYLRTVLKNRLTRAKTASYKNRTPEISSYTSVGGSAIQYDLPSVEDPKTSGETDHGHSASYLQREKQHLEEDLDSAQRNIQEKGEVIEYLMEEKTALKIQLQDAKKEIESMQREMQSFENVNSDLKVQLQEAKENIESLQNKLISNNTEMTGMKVEIKGLKDELHTVSEELKELRPLKKFLEPKKSKTCLLM